MTSLSLDLAVITPELLMALGAMAMLMAGVFQGDRSHTALSASAVAVMAIAALAVVTGGEGRMLAFSGSLVVDGFARFAKLLILLGASLAIVMAHGFFVREKIARFEFPVLIMFAALGMMLMVSANDFIALYMGVELQSLALYVLASFNRDSLRSTEAGLKYFVLGALSSGMLLYGISLIYGFTGSTGFETVAMVVHAEAPGIGIVFGLVFLAAGLAFKISAVPFHMWTPDVYEGAPTPITAFFSTAPKVAALALFTRALIEPFPDALEQWRQIIVFIAILSMALGAFAAIGQQNIKRLMAYSSIGHMGYALVGLAAGTAQGVQGVLVYLAIYLVTNAGAFCCILAMRRKDGMVETIGDLAGLARTNPPMAFAFAMLMLSLAGIPPLAGFFAKWYVFLAAIQAGLYPLAVIGVLASVVGAFYYLRIVKLIYFDEPAPAFEPDIGAGLTAILTGSAIFTLFFMVAPALIADPAARAAAALFP